MTGDNSASRRRFLGALAGGVAGAGLVGGVASGSEGSSADAGVGDTDAGDDVALDAGDAAATTHTEWPMFGQNAQHRGATNDQGPADGVRIGWQTDRVATAAALKNNRLVFGTEDGVVAVGDTDGEEDWTFETETPVGGCPAVYDREVFAGTEGGRCTP